LFSSDRGVLGDGWDVWIGLDGTQIFWGAQGSFDVVRTSTSRVHKGDTHPSTMSHPIGACLCVAGMPAAPASAIELHHDGACAFERAADPLHCARIDTEAFRNDAHTWSPRNRRGLSDACFCGGYRRPAQPLSFTPGPRKPGTDSFLHNGPLELGEHAHHLKHRLAGR
jgi:hypothetical protein